MMHPDTTDTAVIVPARNEADRIGGCLAALAGQCGSGVTVILVINNTTDDTAAIARASAARHGLHLVVLARTLPPDQGVGTARRIGCDHALQTMPHLRFILTTDADCIVAPDWIARNRAHLRRHDAVCGKVGLIASEADILDGMDLRLATLEGTYRTMVQRCYARHAAGCADIDGTHGEAAGASLGFTKPAYLAVGGFAPVKCGEDRMIVRTLRAAGCSVRHADDVTVQASCRLTGRAAGGMSDALRARITGASYPIDDCLPPAHWLIARAARRALGPWPPRVPSRLRVDVRDLPRHIAMLECFEDSGGPTPVPSARTAAGAKDPPDRPLSEPGAARGVAAPDLPVMPAVPAGMPSTPNPKVSAMPTVKGPRDDDVERSVYRRTSGPMVRQ